MCYTRICDEGDVEMNRKPSRFAFINKMRAELDKREEKALESQEQYIEEKRQKREQKREQKQNISNYFFIKKDKKWQKIHQKYHFGYNKSEKQRTFMLTFIKNVI